MIVVAGILTSLCFLLAWYAHDTHQEAEQYRTWFDNERERNEKLAEKIAKLNEEKRNVKVQGR